MSSLSYLWCVNLANPVLYKYNVKGEYDVHNKYILASNFLPPINNGSAIYLYTIYDSADGFSGLNLT